jgi:hypothetical protein
MEKIFLLNTLIYKFIAIFQISYVTIILISRMLKDKKIWKVTSCVFTFAFRKV